jgi:hypothetical protein
MKGNRNVAQWLRGVEFIQIIKMKVDNPPRAMKDALRREWFRILSGERVLMQSPLIRVRPSARNSVLKKLRHGNPIKGDCGYRKPKEEFKVPKKRPSRGD